MDRHTKMTIAIDAAQSRSDVPVAVTTPPAIGPEHSAIAEAVISEGSRKADARTMNGALFFKSPPALRIPDSDGTTICKVTTARRFGRDTSTSVIGWRKRITASRPTVTRRIYPSGCERSQPLRQASHGALPSHLGFGSIDGIPNGRIL